MAENKNTCVFGSSILQSYWFISKTQHRMCDSTLWTWLWTHSHANTWTQKVLSVDMAAIRKIKQAILLLLQLLVQKTETETLLTTALAIERATVQGAWNESPGHAALGLALVRAVIFCHVNTFFHAMEHSGLVQLQEKVAQNICLQMLKIRVSSTNAFVSQQNYHHYPQTSSASPLCYENPLNETPFCNVYIRIQTEKKNLGCLFKVREVLQCWLYNQ